MVQKNQNFGTHDNSNNNNNKINNHFILPDLQKRKTINLFRQKLPKKVRKLNKLRYIKKVILWNCFDFVINCSWNRLQSQLILVPIP